MELQKGVCFSCNDKKLILNHCSERIQQIFENLYTETVLNVQKLQSITPSLKLCPVCHHKLILLEQFYKQIQANRNENEDENCILCKKGEFIFKISKGNYFKDISDDFPVFSDKNKYNVCSECCFYLDGRYILKKRLFLKYPQLRIVPKLKLKFGSEIISSTPLKTKKDRSVGHQRRSAEVICISDTEDLSAAKDVKDLDLSTVKSFKTLRHNKLLRKSKMINEDPKLLSQILYVKITKNNFPLEKQIPDVQIEKDQEVKAEITSKKSKRSEKKKDLDKISAESSFEEIVDSDKSMEKEMFSKHDTDSSNMKKSTYFKIKLKKPSPKSKKVVVKKHHNDIKQITTAAGFRKSLVINLERRAILRERSDSVSEKHIENGKDISIEVLESEKQNKILTDSLRMEVDTLDESKVDNFSEEQISLKITEESDTPSSEEEQMEMDREEASENNEISSISDKESSHENDEDNKNNKNTVPNSPLNKSEEESDELANLYVKKVNSDREEPSEDPKDREGQSEENIRKRRESTSDTNEEKKDQVSDNGSPENEEDNCNEKSEENLKDSDHKLIVESDQEKETDVIELFSKKGEEETENEQKSKNDGKKEEEHEKKSDVEKNNAEKESADKNEHSDKEIGIDDEDRSNINLLLSGLESETSESGHVDSDRKGISENNSKDASPSGEESEEITGSKRKRTDSPDSSSNPEKKKKKVTFSEDVLDSSE